MTDKTQPRRYHVGIGASAGGLEAISAFFKHMPTDSGLIFFVIQHLSPNYRSMMDELLAKVTAMPIHIVTDGMDPQPNHIYLIPPNNNMTIFHGKLLLESQDRSSSPGVVNLPIDLFLDSLAQDQERYAVGIILSGTGSDGTRGCRAIKEAGGLVMVQSEASAKFEGMPKNVLANGLQDFVLPVEELPAQLLKFVHHPLSVAMPQKDVELAGKSAMSKIFAMLRHKTKIDFTFYKPPTISRRIERRISINQIQDIDGYVEFLKEHPSELSVLSQELLIGVTNFYRDRDVFDTLARTHLVDLIQEAEGREVRFWVAGCSTGEEAYTYCMLVHEIAQQLGQSINLKLFATDIDQVSLGKASQGIYPESIAADLPPDLLNKYMVRMDDKYHVSRALRESVVFARHDLNKDPPFTNIDLVSCRNLLIYLQPVLQRRIFDGFNFALKPNGLLVLGSSESLGDAEPYFEVLDQRSKIFKSRGNRKSLLSSDRFRLPDLSPGSEWSAESSQARSSGAARNEDVRVLESFIEALAKDFMPVAFIVDDQLQLLRVVGDAKPYLRPLSGKVSADITKHLIEALGIPVSTGLTKLFKTQSEVSFSNITVRSDAESSKVNVFIRPLSVRRNAPLLAAVLISEAARPVRLEAPDGEGYDMDAEAIHRIGDLEQELQFTRENLQATIEELETSNEELQVTNEELLASNEELQSTNEELQSVNEELFTVNAEYQGKISELGELNSDMENFMGATRMIVVFLDTDLNIRRFTKNAKQLFNVMEHDRNRPLKHISHRLLNIDLIEATQNTLRDKKELDLEIQAEDENWYHLRVLPYKLNHDVQAGVVITLHEITDRKNMQDDLLMMHKRRLLTQELSDSATWDWDIQTQKVECSDNMSKLLGLPEGTQIRTYDAVQAQVHPDDVLALKACVDEAIASGASFAINHRVIWPDGTVRAMTQRGAALTNSKGETTNLLGVLHANDACGLGLPVAAQQQSAMPAGDAR